MKKESAATMKKKLAALMAFTFLFLVSYQQAATSTGLQTIWKRLL